MKFSICIPNYNYGHYIRETIQSALTQDADVEVLVADNASTDDSVALVNGIDDPRVRLSVNRWNVGFAGNLDRACHGATGERMILLSSDDLINPGALATYTRLLDAVGAEADGTILDASQYVVDGAGAVNGRQDHDQRQWRGAVVDEALSNAAGAKVWSLPAAQLLANSMHDMRNPMFFAATCYSRTLYDAVEGYGGVKLINPDKHFMWKALTRAKFALHVEAPLFSYRVHATNQGAQQAQSGALKHLVDQYIFTFDTPDESLAVAGVKREELAAAFIEHDIALRGLKLLAEGKRIDARRAVAMGFAAYPALARRSRKLTALRVLLKLGPAGTAIARSRYERALAAFKQGG